MTSSVTPAPGSVSRRALLRAAAVVLAGPSCAYAVPSIGRRRIVAILLGPTDNPDPITPARKAWAARFAKHGFTDGRDIEIAIVRPAVNDWTKLFWGDAGREHVRAAVSLSPDVIVAILHDLELTVMPFVGDVPVLYWGPEIIGGVHDLNRKGRNITGLTNAFQDLVHKRFEFAKEIKPSSRRVAFVEDEPPNIGDAALARRWEEKARWMTSVHSEKARRLGLEAAFIRVPRNAPVGAVVTMLRTAQIDIAEVGVDGGPELWLALARIGVATTVIGPDKVKEGALLGGWSTGNWQEVLARQAAKVLRGERASAIPVERMSEFGLALNLRTARLLGATVPPAILMRANQVFQ